MNYNKIDNIKVEGIDPNDYPNFCDAFIASADYDGKPMKDQDLDELNNDSDFVYQCIESQLY